ncbi:tail completion protein [Haloquadratum phage sp.]|nr:tail completion protein [Haloquadratum phage sp.]
MTVRIQSGTTVFINSGQTVQTPQVQNAGAITNAGTTQQFRSNVASGSGSGLGTARTSPIPFPRASGIGEDFGQATASTLTDRRASGSGSGVGTAIERPFRLLTASGFGEGFGQASVITAEFIKSGQTVDIDRVIRDGFDDIQNAGTLTNAGATIDIKQDKIALPAATNGQGQLFGQATTSRFTDRQASGISEGFGQATKIRTSFRQATGIGQGLGTAIENPFRLAFADFFFEPPDDINPLGFGQAFGQATPLTLFDPIQHMVGILNDITASELSLPKPERIAPIWEYSHNDRINFPDPALYVYAPTEATVDKFSIDADTTNQTNTIEILIMTLAQERTRAYQQDFVRYLTQFYDDNQTETGFHRFENITASDIRNEHITQQTDHYIASVTVEVQKFTDI